MSFHNSIIGNFMVYQDQLEKFYCSYSVNQNIPNGFLQFLLLLLRSTLLRNRNKHDW